jgi:DUF1365 family protein
MIQSDLDDIEQIRARIRAMSDLELRKYGRAARDLADPKKNPLADRIRRSSFNQTRARTEWKRRHPKAS